MAVAVYTCVFVLLTLLCSTLYNFQRLLTSCPCYERFWYRWGMHDSHILTVDLFITVGLMLIRHARGSPQWCILNCDFTVCSKIFEVLHEQISYITYRLAP